MRLNNKVALVTGAASGLGQAIASAYLEEGARVILADIQECSLPDNDRASFAHLDVSNREEVQRVVNSTVEETGRLDIMVNNAGIGPGGSVMETSDEDWSRTLEVNLSGVFYGLREAANRMREAGTGGSIINTSSILGRVAFPEAAAYCASKGGVVQLTRAAALDCAPYNIRVNAVAPGFIKTPMTRDLQENQEEYSAITGNTPLGRMGEPKDIAAGAVFLASDEASFITGEVLYIDGGWTAR